MLVLTVNRLQRSFLTYVSCLVGSTARLRSLHRLYLGGCFLSLDSSIPEWYPDRAGAHKFLGPQSCAHRNLAPLCPIPPTLQRRRSRTRTMGSRYTLSATTSSPPTCETWTYAASPVARQQCWCYFAVACTRICEISPCFCAKARSLDARRSERLPIMLKATVQSF